MGQKQGVSKSNPKLKPSAISLKKDRQNSKPSINISMFVFIMFMIADAAKITVKSSNANTRRKSKVSKPGSSKEPGSTCKNG